MVWKTGLFDIGKNVHTFTGIKLVCPTWSNQYVLSSLQCYYMLFSYQTGYIMWHSRLMIYIPQVAAEGNIEHKPGMSHYITNLVCYAYFHWLFNPECQHIFGKQTGYICAFSVSLIWAPKNNNNVVDKNRNIYASLNQYHNTE